MDASRGVPCGRRAEMGGVLFRATSAGNGRAQLFEVKGDLESASARHIVVGKNNLSGNCRTPGATDLATLKKKAEKRRTRGKKGRKRKVTRWESGNPPKFTVTHPKKRRYRQLSHSCPSRGSWGMQSTTRGRLGTVGRRVIGIRHEEATEGSFATKIGIRAQRKPKRHAPRDPMTNRTKSRKGKKKKGGGSN